MLIVSYVIWVLVIVALALASYKYKKAFDDQVVLLRLKQNTITSLNESLLQSKQLCEELKETMDKGIMIEALKDENKVRQKLATLEESYANSVNKYVSEIHELKKTIVELESEDND